MLFSKGFNIIYSGKIKAEDVWDVVNVVKILKKTTLCVFHSCFSVTADTFLVEGNKQEHQLSNLKPSTTYSVGLYATKGPLTSGTVITNLQTRMY